MQGEDYEIRLPLKDGNYEVGNGLHITREAFQRAIKPFIQSGVICDVSASGYNPNGFIGEPVSAEAGTKEVKITFRLYPDNERAKIVAKMLREAPETLEFGPMGFIEGVTMNSDGTHRRIDRIILESIGVHRKT